MASLEEVAAFIRAEFADPAIEVLELVPMGSRVRFHVGPAHRRPGGTVQGPVLMTVADVALYVAILGEIGIVPMAVTTQLNIHFLRMPRPDADIIGECRLIKRGKTLVVGEVTMYSEGEDDPVGHATGTYALPPAHRQGQLPNG